MVIVGAQLFVVMVPWYHGGQTIICGDCEETSKQVSPCHQRAESNPGTPVEMTCKDKTLGSIAMHCTSLKILAMPKAAPSAHHGKLRLPDACRKKFCSINENNPETSGDRVLGHVDQSILGGLVLKLRLRLKKQPQADTM